LSAIEAAVVDVRGALISAGVTPLIGYPCMFGSDVPHKNICIAGYIGLIISMGCSNHT